jgi:hypothetical protein
MKVTRSGATPTRLMITRRPITSLDAPAREQIVLAGAIEQLDISGTVSSQSENLIGLTAAKNSFRATIRPDVTRIRPIHRGAFTLSAETLQIANTLPLKLGPSNNTGAIAFASASTWKGAVFRFPYIEGVSTLSFRSSGPTTFSYALSSSSAYVTRSTYETSLARESGRLTVAGTSISASNITADLSVTINGERTSFNVNALSAETDSLFWPASVRIPALAKGRIRIKHLLGNASTNSEAASFPEMRASGVRFTPAPTPNCTAALATLNPIQSSAFKRRGLFSPLEQRQQSIDDSMAALKALGPPNYVVYVPRDEVLAQVKNRLYDFDMSDKQYALGDQEIVACLTLSKTAEIIFPVKVLLHLSASLEGEDLVIRPSVEMFRLPVVAVDAPMPIATLVSFIETALQKALGKFDAAHPEIRHTLPLHFATEVSFGSTATGYQLAATPKNLAVASRSSVVLIQPSGLTIIGAMEKQ